MIGEQVPLVDNSHSGLRGCLPDAWAKMSRGVSKHQHFTTRGATPAPSRRKSDHGAIFGDDRRVETQSLLYRGKLDHGTTGRKNQLDVGSHPRYVRGRDCEAVVRIEKCSINVAEQGNASKAYSA